MGDPARKAPAALHHVTLVPSKPRDERVCFRGSALTRYFRKAQSFSPGFVLLCPRKARTSP